VRILVTRINLIWTLHKLCNIMDDYMSGALEMYWFYTVQLCVLFSLVFMLLFIILYFIICYSIQLHVTIDFYILLHFIAFFQFFIKYIFSKWRPKKASCRSIYKSKNVPGSYFVNMNNNYTKYILTAFL